MITGASSRPFAALRSPVVPLNENSLCGGISVLSTRCETTWTLWIRFGTPPYVGRVARDEAGDPHRLRVRGRPLRLATWRRRSARCGSPSGAPPRAAPRPSSARRGRARRSRAGPGCRFEVTTNCASCGWRVDLFCFALKNASAPGPPMRSFVAPFFGSFEQRRDLPPRDPVARLPERQHDRRRDRRPRLGERRGEHRPGHLRLVDPASAASTARPRPKATRVRATIACAGRLAVEDAAGRGRDDRRLQSVEDDRGLVVGLGRRPSAIRPSSAFSVAWSYDRVRRDVLPKRRSFIRRKPRSGPKPSPL